MGADVLETQGAKASAIMIMTLLNWVNSVPTCQGLTNVNIMQVPQHSPDQWVISPENAEMFNKSMYSVYVYDSETTAESP